MRPGFIRSTPQQSVLVKILMQMKKHEHKSIIAILKFVLACAYSFRSLERDEKEDIYQLGLILLEIITGKPIGSGGNDSLISEVFELFTNHQD